MIDVSKIAMQAGSLSITPGDIAIAAAVAIWVVYVAKWVVALPASASLDCAPPRRNSLGPYMVPIICFGWLSIMVIAAMAARLISMMVFDLKPEPVLFVAMAVCYAVSIPVLLLLAKKTFARGLKGFGLNLATALKDIPRAAVGYAAIFPVVSGIIILTTYLGPKIFGPEFALEVNEGITAVTGSKNLLMLVVLVLHTTIFVPIFEELLFRGFVQSALRGYVKSPWLSIAIASFIFTILHPITHWGGIFVFSMWLGYTFEKSGSLLRSIFLHIIFNAVSIAAALLSQ